MITDLTNNPNCYAYYLARLSPSVEEMFHDPGCSLLKMLETVRVAVLKAQSTPARRRFLMYLGTECFSKHDVQALCYNAIARGRNHQS